MTARPRRQPATDTAPAPVTKQPMDHPASAARTATAPVEAPSAPETAPETPAEDPLEPFSTRIRRSQLREIDRVRYLTGKSKQEIISEALAPYLQEQAANHLD